MSIAPNETQEGYNRKNELFRIRDQRQLTMEELYELRDLTRIAVEGLVFVTGKPNN